MKISRTCWLLLLLSESVLATRTNMIPGAGSTLGPGSNEYSLFSGRFNPAMGMLMVRDTEHWRTGYFPTLATSLELGNFDDFSAELEDLIDLIDDSSKAKDSVDVTLERFNKLLISMGKEGYLKNTTGIYFPLFYRDDLFGGTLNLDLNYEIQAAARILNDPLSFDKQNNSFATNTSVYLKSGIEKTINLAYSHPVFEHNEWLAKHGKLYGGLRVSLVDLDLSKQVLWLEGVRKNKVADIVRDEYNRELTNSQQVSIDAGIVFDAEKYRLGFTVTNINSPEFKYNLVGTDCTAKLGSVEEDNCHVAQFFIEEKQLLKAKEIHKKNMLATVDATYKVSDKWLLMGAYDLATYNDVVGFENQMFNIGMSYETSGHWLPSPRIGYQSNLADKGLSNLSIGFTFFKCVTLDIAASSNKTTIDGTTVPRYVSFSLGFEETF